MANRVLCLRCTADTNPVKKRAPMRNQPRLRLTAGQVLAVTWLELVFRRHLRRARVLRPLRRHHQHPLSVVYCTGHAMRCTCSDHRCHVAVRQGVCVLRARVGMSSPLRPRRSTRAVTALPPNKQRHAQEREPRLPTLRASSSA